MIIPIVGTGTGIGKTHLAAALLRHLRSTGHRALGWKPVESGVADGVAGEDERALRDACGEPAETLRLVAPLAPNLAARLQGAVIDAAALRARLYQLAARWPVLVVELAGGWFSPFDDELDNAEWLAGLSASLRVPLRPVLVAPDRLGVLHDLSAALRAAAPLGLAPAGLALSAPAVADDATRRNAAELARRSLTRALPLVTLPRAPSSALAELPALAELAAALLR